MKWIRVLEETSRVSATPGGANPYNQTFLVSCALAFSVKNFLGMVPVERGRLRVFRGAGGQSDLSSGTGCRGASCSKHADICSGRSGRHALLYRLSRTQEFDIGQIHGKHRGGPRSRTESAAAGIVGQRTSGLLLHGATHPGSALHAVPRRSTGFCRRYGPDRGLDRTFQYQLRELDEPPRNAIGCLLDCRD